jgi:hypothetical protein
MERRETLKTYHFWLEVSTLVSWCEHITLHGGDKHVGLIV